MREVSLAPLFFRGFILIVLGFFALLTTDEGINKMSLIPAMVLTVSGITIALFSYFTKKSLSRWGLYFGSGVFIMAIGIFVLLRPEMVVRVLFIGFSLWFFYQAAIDFMDVNNWRKKPHSNWWQMGLLATTEVILGLLIIINPSGVNMAQTMYLGTALLVGGVVSLVVGYNLRAKFNKKLAINTPQNTEI